MRNIIAMLLLLTFSCILSNANAGSLQIDLKEALAKLELGTIQLEENHPRSSTTLSEAAAQFEELIMNYEIETAGIYHALGNAYLLNDELGHAVLSYRKGEQIDPTHAQIRASLAHARSTVPLNIEPGKISRVWSMLLSWRGVISRPSIWYTFMSLSLFGWIACSARVSGIGPKRLGAVGMWLIIASLIPIAMLGTEWARFHNSPLIVITSTHVNARSGPDHEIYDAVFVDGLVGGVEGTILETRNNWHRLLLADGSQCWVPATALGKVNPES